MAKSAAGITTTRSEKGAVPDITAVRSAVSRKAGKKPTEVGRKPSNITPQDVVDIFNSDLNRLKETFGPVQIQADAGGKLYIVLPNKLRICRVCRITIIHREGFDLCPKHDGDLAQKISDIVDKELAIGPNGSAGTSG